MTHWTNRRNLGWYGTADRAWRTSWTSSCGCSTLSPPRSPWASPSPRLSTSSTTSERWVDSSYSTEHRRGICKNLFNSLPCQLFCTTGQLWRIGLIHHFLHINLVPFILFLKSSSAQKLAGKEFKNSAPQTEATTFASVFIRLLCYEVWQDPNQFSWVQIWNFCFLGSGPEPFRVKLRELEH